MAVFHFSIISDIFARVTLKWIFWDTYIIVISIRFSKRNIFYETLTVKIKWMRQKILKHTTSKKYTNHLHPIYINEGLYAVRILYFYAEYYFWAFGLSHFLYRKSLWLYIRYVWNLEGAVEHGKPLFIPRILVPKQSYQVHSNQSIHCFPAYTVKGVSV